MPKLRRWIDVDVLTEARRRIRDIYDRFDTVVVAFSGGKDSLVVLHLAKEAAKNAGKLPVHVVFRDEETIHKEVIDFVNEYRQMPWIDMEWWAVPLTSYRYVLGESLDYVQWDAAREGNWVREKPEWALREADLGIPVGVPISQHTCDLLMVRRRKKRKQQP